jgi:hypothetical protein
MKAPRTAVSARAWPVVHREGRDECARHPGDRRECDQEQVQTVHGEAVVDPQLGDPLVVRDVLEAAAGLEVHEHRDHIREHDQRPDQDGPARSVAPQEGAHQAREQRHEEDYRQVDRHEPVTRK